MTGRITRASAVFAAVLIVATVATGAVRAQSAPVEPRYKGDGGKIRMLENPNGSIVMIRYVIQKYQLDRKYGFSMELVPVSNIQAATVAIQSGSADVGTADFLVVARMRQAGVDVVGIAPLLRWNDDIVAQADQGIRTLGDLKGKRVGTINRVASPWLVMRAAARNIYHFDLEKQATIQEGNMSLLRGLLEQDRLDGSFMFDSFTPEVTQSGKYRLVAHISDLVTQLGLPADSPFLLTMATSRFAADHPSDLRAFLAAYREAVHILGTDDQVWVELGPVMKTAPAMVMSIRDEMRRVLLSKFSPDSLDAMIRTFTVLRDTAGSDALGLSALPSGFITTDFE